MNDDVKRRQVAVALEYEPGTHAAPRVVAKGHGIVAERILEAARENGVAIEANPMLAEALSRVHLDDTIPPELYAAVAEVSWAGSHVIDPLGRQRSATVNVTCCGAFPLASDPARCP